MHAERRKYRPGMCFLCSLARTPLFGMAGLRLWLCVVALGSSGVQSFAVPSMALKLPTKYPVVILPGFGNDARDCENTFCFCLHLASFLFMFFARGGSQEKAKAHAESECEK